MADWHWEADPDTLLDDLPARARGEAERLSEEITVRESMVFLEGATFTGRNPGVRTVSRGRLLLTYLTDIRGERIVVIQVAWFD
ncbi:hypothetical protein NGB36_32725 [Streptomyces sp. RB6PN25]|uniref:SnoaL-like domain-containing protein n=1 Tax=Streptomyces humicola TaxID=2953240 RepID=A0ABT1Q5K2_9ACTN|nr:hypothetical protein [Streptomyces humicola]MCQ4085198.1 hypothetical protein [Streptomyces humicola]